MRVSGDVGLRDWQVGQHAILLRLTGRLWLQWVGIMVGFGAALWLILQLVDCLLELHHPARDTVGGLVGLGFFLGGIFGLTELYNRTVRSGLRRIGVPEETATEYRVMTEGLEVVSPTMSFQLSWAGVHEVFRFGRQWNLLGDTGVVVLPARLFTDVTEERAFVGEVLARIPPSALERSGQAAAFAQG